MITKNKKSEANHQTNRRVPFMPIQPASLNATRLHAPDEQKEKYFQTSWKNERWKTQDQHDKTRDETQN